MTTGFSKVALLWAESAALLSGAQTRFRADWGKILRSVAAGLVSREWTIREFGSPVDLLQAYRLPWPSGEDQLHYEVGYHLETGIYVSLHVEAHAPAQKALCARLRELLGRHENGLTGTGGKRSPRLCKEPMHEILCLWLPFDRVSDDALAGALDSMLETESFVEEALFTAGKNKVWRSDFLPDDPPAKIEWDHGSGDDKVGGWKPSRNRGRLGGPCLECHPKPKNHAKGNILTLEPTKGFREFANGARAYASATVHSGRGGSLVFYGEAPKAGGFQRAFDVACEIPPLDRWQTISREFQISTPDKYDFAQGGLNAFLIVQAPEGGLRIGSIELGLCP
jgi:hypothetical protein